MVTAIDIERDAVAKAYSRWAPVYDLVFGPVFERGRHTAILAAEQIGGRILEVGVGTGISLPDYSRTNRIFGVDISDAMLCRARERVAELGLNHVEGLEVMDAEHWRFPTPRSTSWSRNMSSRPFRTRKPRSTSSCACSSPGGEIIILSRVGAEAGLRKAIEHWFAPAARKLGWRTEFPWERYSQWTATDIRKFA